MVSAVLQPEIDNEPSPAARQLLMTLVVPAPAGCNLKCSFCLVRQRQEITDTLLRAEDYTRFIREAAEQGPAPIFAIAIQGYEPLLPEALPYTQAILATGRFLGRPTTLVTNGVRLADALDLLAALSPNKIAISLDAASAAIHDRIRGVAGAWTATVIGIKRAVEALAPLTRLVVASVLLPTKRHYLDAMPALLREIGIDRWIINPLLRVGTDQAGGPVSDRASLYRDLLILKEAADRARVRLTVDDEFDHLRHDAACISEPSLRALRVRTVPRNLDILRLAPSGQCSTGADILRQVTPDTPRWQPGITHAGDFLEMLSKRPCQTV